MGNSEVGHLNIGAGRIVHMDITRIDLMIQNGEFFSHPVLVEALTGLRTVQSGRVTVQGIETTRFGPLVIEPEDLLDFPAGLMGMEECRRWGLLQDVHNDELSRALEAGKFRATTA